MSNNTTTLQELVDNKTYNICLNNGDVLRVCAFSKETIVIVSRNSKVQMSFDTTTTISELLDWYYNSVFIY